MLQGGVDQPARGVEHLQNGFIVDLARCQSHIAASGRAGVNAVGDEGAVKRGQSVETVGGLVAVFIGVDFTHPFQQPEGAAPVDAIIGEKCGVGIDRIRQDTAVFIHHAVEIAGGEVIVCGIELAADVGVNCAVVLRREQLRQGTLRQPGVFRLRRDAGGIGGIVALYGYAAGGGRIVRLRGCLCGLGGSFRFRRLRRVGEGAAAQKQRRRQKQAKQSFHHVPPLFSKPVICPAVRENVSVRGSFRGVRGKSSVNHRNP